MESNTCSLDLLEQIVVDAEREIARQRARQILALDGLDRAQVATADGAKNLSEWTARRLDIGLDTARTLVRTMRRTQDRRALRESLIEADATFDRVEAVSRIATDVGLMDHLDIGAIRREAGIRAEISAAAEMKTAEDRFLVVQPSLDESWWKLWGGLDGYSGAIVNKVLTETADQLPVLPDGSRGNSSWRKATALLEVCISDDAPPAQITVFVDAGPAALTDARSGVVLESGPKVGASALEAILCDAITEVTVRAEDGRFMEYGHKQRIVPPALKRAILDRDGNTCAGDGCDSRYRVEAHHIIPWSQGGRTDAENLVSLCWFHHHVVVHQRGFTVFRHPDHGRIRFKPPDPDAHDPPLRGLG